MSALYHGCCNGHDWTTDARNTTLIWTFVQLPSKLAAQTSARRYSTIRELRSILEEKVKAPCGYVGRRDIRIKEPSSHHRTVVAFPDGVCESFFPYHAAVTTRTRCSAAAI